MNIDLLQALIRENMAFGALGCDTYEGDISEALWGAVVRVAGEDVSIDHGAYFAFQIPAEVATYNHHDLLKPFMRSVAYKLAADADAYIRQAIHAGTEASTSLDSVKTAIAAASVPADDLRAVVPVSETENPRLDGFHILPCFDQDDEIIVLAPGSIAFASEIVRMETYDASPGNVGMKGLYMCGAKVLRPDLIWRVPLSVERRLP